MNYSKMIRKKCKPQTLPNSEKSNCGYPIFMDTQKLYRDNINDIAKSLGIIMIICGIHECKANSAVDIIKSIFRHYNEARHRPNCAEQPKKMCKNNVIICLSKKCLMTLVEAQLTYYIIKYALKAYFNGMPEIGIRNDIMDNQIICEQETAWMRAAKRTAQVYEECKDILKSIVKNYYAEIKDVYKSLFQRIKQRTEPLEIPGYKMSCRSSEKLGMLCSTSQQSLIKLNTENIKEKSEMEKEFPFDGFPKCCKCKFPLDLCGCRINPITGKLCIDCSQGPYTCEWYRMDKEYRVKAKYHVCPIDCEKDSSLLSEDECHCDLPQSDDCETEDNETDDSEFEKDFNVEAQNDCVEESESVSEECEPKMEGCTYCCHMPVCDRKIYMEVQKRPPHLKRDSDEPIFVEFQMIPPSKNKKNVRLPPESLQRKKRLAIQKEKRWLMNNLKLMTDKEKTATSTDEKNDKNLEEQFKTGNSDNNKITSDQNNTGMDSAADVNQRHAGDKGSKHKIDGNKSDRTKSNGVKFGRNNSYGNRSDGIPNDGKNGVGVGVKHKYDNHKKGNQKSNLLSSARKNSEQHNGGEQRKHNKGERYNGQKRNNGEKSKKYGRGNLPCCKCGNKQEKIKPAKCLRCKPVLIPKNRIIPAPIVC